MKSPLKNKWITAFLKEIKSLETTAAMHIVPRPQNTFIIPVRTLFSIKYDNLTKITTEKCRIVARGDIQKKYLGDKRTKYSAPVANAVTLRIFLLDSLFEEELEQLDIKTAFLHGRLPSGKYFELPTGHPKKRGKEIVWFSECALYGSLEGANAWYFTLCDKLISYGLTQCLSDPCLFKLKRKEGTLKLLIYVDVILVSAPTTTVDWIKDELRKTFTIKNTKEIEEHVGLGIKRSEEFIELGHESKIDEAIEAWELTQAKSVDYPITDIIDKDEEIMKDIKPFQSLIGSLNYITIGSRPDISFATNFLARRTQKASKRLLKMGKNILVYLRETKKQKIKLFKRKMTERTRNCLTVYVDASFASEVNRNSVYGFLIYLNDSLIYYRSRKLPMIVLSSTEAEYVGLCKCVQEILWIKNILKEMEITLKTTLIYCDSQPAIKMVKSPMFNGRTKHIDLKLQFIREQYAKGEFLLEYIESKKNLADLLTKPIKGQQFGYLRKCIFQRHFYEVREGVDKVEDNILRRD